MLPARADHPRQKRAKLSPMILSKVGGHFEGSMQSFDTSQLTRDHRIVILARQS